MKTKDIFKLYDAIFDAIFAGNIEQPALEVYSSDDEDYFGLFNPETYTIEIIKDYHYNTYQMFDTLLHELVHAEQIIYNNRINPDCYHDSWFNKKFKKYKRKLRKAWRK